MEDGVGITTYSYDELNRQKTVTYPGNKTISYSYDAVGNRATMMDPDGGLTTYSYDSRNLLTALENAYNERTTWQYDALGRVQRRPAQKAGQGKMRGKYGCCPHIILFKFIAAPRGV